MALSKVKKWQFPVVAKSSNNAEDKKKLNAKPYYQALLSAKNGFYPVGLNKFVHMGIHIDKDVLDKLNTGEPIKTKVNCIADGEVIAYRVNGHYPKIDYDEKVAFFSTGFVLVRHLLEMERVPEENTETAESEPPAADNNAPTQVANADTNSATDSTPAVADTAPSRSPTTDTGTSPAATPAPTTTETTENEKKEPGHQLYFYSLYMHMADSAYYDKNPEEPVPAFWDQDIYRVIDNNKLDYVEGLNIRKNPDSSKNDEILAVLEKGTKVNLNLTVHDENKQWYAVSGLAEGYSSIPVLTPQKYQHGETTVEILGWIFTGREVTETEFTILGSEEDKKLVAKNAANEMKSNQKQSKGLRVRNDFTNKDDKKIYSMLPAGTQIKISGTKKPNNYVELIEVVRNGKPTRPLPTEKKKVWYDSLENITRGKKYDEVVVLDKPYSIKKGELVGHIGNYHDYKAGIDKEGKLQDIETLPEDTLQRPCFKPLLHVECFTCEDLTNYITQTQTEAGKLVDADKPFLAISKGAKLLATPNQGDTTVGKPYTGTQIKVKSKNVSIKWIQIEINTSETETKTLWIENSEEVAKTAKPGGEISLNENTVAWSQHPLQLTELANSPQTTDIPLLLYLNDEELTSRDKRAEDEQGTIWWRVAALDERNLPIVGWVSNKGEGVKKVSAWDWFDFPQLTESASLVEFYKDVKLSEKRNNDNPSLDKYKPTLKTTLSILDRQYLTDSPENKKYAYIKSECFRGIIEKPILFEALGRLLINYQSEWYSEVGTDGKMPEWEALNSEMTDDAENALDYLKDGDEAKRDAYLKNIGKTADSEEAIGLNQRRERISRFPENYEENPKEKLNQEQFKDYNYMHELEVKVEMWEKEKEKIKKCLWWKDVVNGLANQNQPTTEDNAGNVNGANTQTAQTDTSPPATLNQDGKAWYIHPISMMNYFKPLAGITTYHIYQNGKIEKHTPSEILLGYEKKYKYVYHDKSNKEHELGIFTVHITKAMARGNIRQNYDVELINVKEFEEGYCSSDGNVKAKFATFNSDHLRWYINPDCFAGLLGAMLELSIDYMGFNGFSTYDAKSVESKSHINGVAGDLRYISTKRNGELTWLSYSSFDFEKQEEFNEALYKFGWARTSLMYSEYFTYKKQPNTLLKYTKHMKKPNPNGYDHYHHLHICGFDFNLIKNIQDEK